MEWGLRGVMDTKTLFFKQESFAYVYMQIVRGRIKMKGKVKRR